MKTWLVRIRALKGLDEFFDIEGWREYYLNLMLIMALIVIPVGLTASMRYYLSEGRYGLIVIDIAVILLLFLSFFTIRGKYARSVLFFVTLYSMLLVFIVTMGPFHARPGWIVLITVTSALLFGTTAVIITTALNALILTLLYLYGGPLLDSWAPVYTEPAAKWTMFTINLSLISLASGLPVSLLLSRLNTSFLHGHELRERLLQERETLSETAKSLRREAVERSRVEEALRRSEERYRILAENARDVIWVFDFIEGYVYVSPSVTKLRGFTQEEAQKQGLDEILAPDSYRKALEILDSEARREREGDPHGPDWSLTTEMEMTCRNGSTVWVEVTANLIYGHTGEVKGFMGISRDISERKRSEEEKRNLESQLVQAQKMEALGTLAGGVAHDFNNILSAVIGYAELSRKILPPESDPFNYASQILKAGSRAKQLVQQILTFSRKSRQEMKPTLAGNIVREALLLLRATIPSTIEIRDALADPGLVMSDPAQIHQVIMNLCTNAAHAMDQEGGVLEVLLDKTLIRNAREAPAPDLQQGSYIRITVSDTGQGMTPDVIERIFEPYFTTKEPGRGTGLGLAVVHGIVINHGGAITCSSTPGKGTAFTVYLPELSSREETMDRPGVEAFIKGSERILLVDDEEALTDLGKKMMEGLGYRVAVCTGGQEALELFRRESDAFDLVITDMTMPGMTGDRLAREIMEIRRGMPVIICTGYSEHISDIKARSLGVRDLIMKPLDMETLARSIRKALDSDAG